ncbi:C-type lectin domain family 4 member A-like [Loxodonta africana]|uniref:C-type lectin domain family 4 member A-like n=1 Tax=Loxodonta africana TaxID=9785 RepID=UPI0030CF1159
MALEITYADVRFKNESDTSGANSERPAAPKEKTSPQQSNDGFPKKLPASLLILLLLLAISSFIAFIIFLQEYSRLLKEKKNSKEVFHEKWICEKTNLNVEATTSSTMLNWSDDKRHPCLVSILRGIAFSLCVENDYLVKGIGKSMSTLSSQKQTSPLVLYFNTMNTFKITFLTLHLYFPLPNTGKVCGCCPVNWIISNTSCYFISSEAKTWTESEKNCSGMGAHLVVINTKEEQLLITQKLKKSSYYLGLSDPEATHQWQWVDQSPYSTSVTFWHHGEPDNHTGPCVLINIRDGSWGWDDASCDVPQKSICELMKIYL